MKPKFVLILLIISKDVSVMMCFWPLVAMAVGMAIVWRRRILYRMRCVFVMIRKNWNRIVVISALIIPGVQKKHSCIYTLSSSQRCVEDSLIKSHCHSCGSGICIATNSNPPNATCLCANNTLNLGYCLTPCGNTNCTGDQLCLSNRHNNSQLCVDISSYYSGCNWGYCGYGNCVADDTVNPANATCLCYDNLTRSSYCNPVTVCGNTTCSSNEICLSNRHNNTRLCIDINTYNYRCNSGYCGYGSCIADETTNPPNASCLCNDNSTKPYCPFEYICGNTTCTSNQICLYNRFYNNQHCVEYDLYWSGCNNGDCGNGSCIADETTNPPDATCLCHDNSTRQSYCPEPNPSSSNKNPSSSNKNPSSNKSPSPSPSKSRGQENRGG